ncbi:hypothetical protein [Komagataeibacter medellinensis]
MTRRAAAVRFGVSSSSVIRWVTEWQTSGRDHALKQGGDRRSHRIEAWSAFLLAAIEAKADISLVELAEKLAVEHGVRFELPRVLWRHFLSELRSLMHVISSEHKSEPQLLLEGCFQWRTGAADC